MKLGVRLGTCLLALLASGCATFPEVEARIATARVLAASGRLVPVTLAAPPFSLQGFARRECESADLSLYIEGDGLAWLNVTTPSPNPTPVNPVGLQLAAVDVACNVVYLGRPGQYLTAPGESRYWLSARFSAEVVAAYTTLIQELAMQRAAHRVHLVGYSGGGAVAALVAVELRRRNAAMGVTLRTVAGNLDVAAWARTRRLSPLTGSLDPAAVADQLQAIPQLHLIGRRDRQVPPASQMPLLQRMSIAGCVQLRHVDAAHGGPWALHWQAVVAQLPGCNGSQLAPAVQTGE